MDALSRSLQISVISSDFASLQGMAKSIPFRPGGSGDSAGSQQSGNSSSIRLLGPVLPDHLLRAIVFEHRERQIERGEVAEHRDREGDLPLRLRQRLALLLGPEAG